MKPIASLLALATACALCACSTAQIQKAGATLAPVLAAAAQDAASSYAATGSVNQQALASDALGGVAAIAQAYVGQPITVAPLASGAGVSTQGQAIGRAVVAKLPVGAITQDLVNQLFTAAAQVAATPAQS